MVVYEIAIHVRHDLVSDFEKFMRDVHIPDLLETGCFTQAGFDEISVGRYRARYFTETRSDLDRYLATYAERLRKDFIAQFPEGIEVSREILEK